MSTSTVNLDRTQYVKVNQGLNAVVLQCLRDSVRIVFSDVKPARDNTAFHLLSGKDQPLTLPFTDTNVWALAVTETSSLVVTETQSNGTSSAEYGLNIQRGLVPGVGVVHVFGRNPDIDTGSGFEDIWNGSTEYTAYNATLAEQISIVSTSADDTNVTGTGAWLIQVIGLDGSYNEINEVIALNGTTPVTSVNSYIRCSIAIILTAGSVGHNVGEITGNQSITIGNVFFNMPQTSNRTLICTYTVPAGKVAYVTGGFATLARKGNVSSEIKVSVRFPGSVFQVVEWFAVVGPGSSYVNRDFEIPLIGIPTGTDIRVQADVDTNNTGIAAGLEILLVDV